MEAEVVKASSVGLGLFLAQKNFPSLVLCQPMFSEGTALELYSALNEDPDLCRIPFFIMPDEEAKGSQTKEFLAKANLASAIGPVANAQELFSALSPYLVQIKDHRPEETTE